MVGFSVRPLPFGHLRRLLGGRLDAGMGTAGAPWTIIAWAFDPGFIARSAPGGAYLRAGGAAGGSGPGRERVLHLPWLVGYALYHFPSGGWTEKNAAIKAGVLRRIADFSLSLLGTFLVRLPGVDFWYHAFATDPERRGIHSRLSFAGGRGFLTVCMHYAPGGSKSRSAFALWSRETSC